MPTPVLFELLQQFCENKLESYSSVKIEKGNKDGIIIHINIKPKFLSPASFQVTIPEVEVPDVERLEMIIEDQNKVIEGQNKVIQELNQKVSVHASTTELNTDTTN